MIAAIALINALQSYLEAANLSPPPNTVGVVETADTNDLPAIVISMKDLIVPSAGLGEHRLEVRGALAANSDIDLAAPILPGTDFNLLSPDRLNLKLFHGGLVDMEGSDTSLGADDIQVRLNATSFNVVPAPPASGEVSVIPQAGQLLFADPLPASGSLSADYFLGHWERRVEQLGGILNVLIIGTDDNDTQLLSDAVMIAMAQAPDSVSGLRKLSLHSAATVSSYSTTPAARPPQIRRQRLLSWMFDFEHIIDQPESSGGMIHRINLSSQADTSPFEEEEIT